MQNAQKCLLEVPLIIVADAREQGRLAGVNGMEVLHVAVVSGRNLAHNSPYGRE
jgi:hypothetical protein